MKKLPIVLMLAALITACAGKPTHLPPQAQPADIPPPTDLLTAPVEGPQAGPQA
ncbi:MAG: hypothetical protein Q4G54_12670 [Pelistega sp.]|nr:hypothetical protein [Pelistega sp.]